MTFTRTVIANIGITSGNIPYSVFANDSKGTPATAVIDSFTQPAHGVVTMTLSGANAGQFTYQPTAGYTGTDSFTYTISNGVGSSVGTVNLTVAAPVIWFVNPAAGSNGTGTLASPFNNMASAVTAIGTNTGQRIFLYSGTATTGVTLKSNGWLIGQGAVGTSFDTVMGLTTQSGWNARPAINGTRPTVGVSSGTGVTLADGNNVQGLNVTNSNGSGITGSAVGTLTLADFDVTVTGGSALSLTTSGTVTATGTDNDLSASGTALNVANVTIGAGGMTFKSVASTTANASPGIVLNTTGSAGGLTVTGTGTTAGSGGTISGKTGNGVDLRSTTNVALKNMNLTGNGTSQTVAGSASTCGGDLVTGNNLSCVANAYLASVTGATFNNVSVTGSGQQGINGNAVNGLTISNCTVTGNGNESFESGIVLQNASGAVSITGTNVRDNRARGLNIGNGTTTMTLTLTNSQFGHTASGTGTAETQQGVALQLFGSSNSTINASGLTISNCDGVGFRANGFLLNADNGGPIVTGSIQTSVFDNNAAHVFVNVGGTSQVTFDTKNNATMTNFNLQSINYTVLGGGAAITANLQGTISGNTINGSALPTGNVDAIDINAGENWSGQVHLRIQSNNIQQVSGGIIAALGGGASANPITPRVDLRIVSNTVSNPAASANEAIRINGAVTSTNPKLIIGCDVGGSGVGNTVSGSWGTQGSGATIYLRNRFTSAGSIILPGYGGGASDSAAVQTYLAGRNSVPAGTVLVTTTVTNPFINGTVTTPLLFARGGVEAKHHSSSATAGAKVTSAPHGSAVAHGSAGPNQNKVEPNGGAVSGTISRRDLDATVAAAIERWTATGLTSEQVALLRGMKFEVAELPGLHLGEADADHIRVDNNAGGNGWFVGSDDAQFAKNISGNRRYTDPAEAPAGRIDLLTAIMHEMGHALGLDDSYSEQDRDNVMYGFLTKGERRVPAKNQAAGIVPNEKSGPHFLASPVNIGTLPPNKSVKIVYSVTVGPITGNPQSISSQGSVASNIATVLTDDPTVGGATDPTVTLLGIAPAFTSANATTFTVGTLGNFSVTANGAPAPSFSFTGSLPSGVTLSAAGVLSGTPAAGTGGTYPITITANNGIAPNAQQSFTLTVNQPPAITSASATTFVVGSAGTFTVTTTGFPAVTVNQTGTLPNGVTYDSATKTLSGTPAAGTGGSYPITFTASNGVGSNAVQSFTLTVNQAPTITSANTTTFTVGTAGNFNVTATGFPSPAINLTSGTLPAGVNFGTGTLAGTPTAFGTFPLTFTASNGIGSNSVQSFSLVVNPSASQVKSGGNIAVNGVGSYKINFLGNPGVQYTVQRVDFLPALPGDWQFVSFQVADTSGMFFIIDNPAVGTTKRFYRAIIP